MYLHKKDKLEVLEFFNKLIYNLILDYHIIYDDVPDDRFEYVD